MPTDSATGSRLEPPRDTDHGMRESALTAVVTQADEPIEDQIGKRPGCMGPAAFAPVTKGGYSVRHADLLPVPTG